jgi:chromosome segregation ATPase
MTSCQHGQNQRQCPLCERDDTIAELTRERDAWKAKLAAVNAIGVNVATMLQEAERERDALRGLTRNLTEVNDKWEEDNKALRAEVERLRNQVADMHANWQRQIAMHEETRARLAAAEKSVEALRAIDGLVVLRGSDIARNEAALAAFDAAKEKTNG